MTSRYFSRAFWEDAFDRVVSTFAQALGAYLVVGGLGILDVNWKTALSVAGMAALLAFLKAAVRTTPGPEPETQEVESVGSSGAGPDARTAVEREEAANRI